MQSQCVILCLCDSIVFCSCQLTPYTLIDVLDCHYTPLYINNYSVKAETSLNMFQTFMIIEAKREQNPMSIVTELVDNILQSYLDCSDKQTRVIDKHYLNGSNNRNNLIIAWSGLQ